MFEKSFWICHVKGLGFQGSKVPKFQVPGFGCPTLELWNPAVWAVTHQKNYERKRAFSKKTGVPHSGALVGVFEKVQSVM